MFVAVVVVCFWRSSWLAFLILTYYINLMHQFLTPLSYLLWRLSYRSYRIFWKRLFPKNNFWVFLSVPHLLDNYAKIVDGRGRNFMCHRTLPSRLVLVNKQMTLNLKNGRDFFSDFVIFDFHEHKGPIRFFLKLTAAQPALFFNQNFGFDI